MQKEKKAGKLSLVAPGESHPHLQKQQNQGQSQKVMIRPMPGMMWNPLKGLPRNRPCPCLSGEKFKKCCLNKLPPVVTLEQAEQFKAQMKLPDLVFVTKTNQDAIRAHAELVAKQKDCPHEFELRFDDAEEMLPTRVCSLCSKVDSEEEHCTKHDWETKSCGAIPGEPEEFVTVCKLCGAEYNEEIH